MYVTKMKLMWSMIVSTHLKLVTRRLRNTNIIASAMFFPRHILPPIPKAKKLFGFDSLCKFIGTIYITFDLHNNLQSVFFLPFIIILHDA